LFYFYFLMNVVVQHSEESADAQALEADRLTGVELKATAEDVKYSTIGREMDATFAGSFSADPLLFDVISGLFAPPSLRSFCAV
jgi:hypothetical protein